MKKAIIPIIIAIILAFTANAVVIHQVLYNPLGTEAGGEAVELYNNANTTTSIGGWKIATEASSRDASIPENTTLCAGCYYLIADEGWSTEKDSPEWPDADYEELINLYNSNSGVALISGDNVIDAVGWGEKSEIGEMFYKGEPANETEEGNSLKRKHYTNDNSNDFEESEPVFSGASLPETEELGIEFEINENSEPRISISTSKIDFGKIDSGKSYEKDFEIQNTGNVKVDLKVKCSGFEGISSAFIDIINEDNARSCESTEKTINLNLEPSGNTTIKIRINAPSEASSGKYSGRVMITPIKS